MKQHKQIDLNIQYEVREQYYRYTEGSSDSDWYPVYQHLDVAFYKQFRLALIAELEDYMDDEVERTAV